MNTRYQRVSTTVDDMEINEAVQVQDICKHYGFGRKKTEILSGLNLTIKKGTIYGLLGPSGCGKTTLLKLITGVLPSDSGFINIFGNPVGSEECRIPGDKVGYMPQEIALFSSFSIKETMIYFGQIFNMSRKDVDRRTRFLLELLHLSDESALVKNLSGGQKRRVSFAVSLIQNAPLLILDEPTVGVDPLLRKSIWNHLETLARQDDVTVIVTTHYINEVQQAGMVGFMRDGKILAEGNPSSLLLTYESSSLNDVFITLCNTSDNLNHSNGHKNQINGVSAHVKSKQNGFYGQSEPLLPPKTMFIQGKKSRIRHRFSKCNYFISTNRTRAVVNKNCVHMKRNLMGMLLQFILPGIIIAMFCLTLGHKPRDLSVGLVNYDAGFLEFGKIFIHSLDANTIKLQNYDNTDAGLAALKKNDIWGLIYIPPNFSTNMIKRLVQFTNVTDEVLQGSKIKLWLDKVNQQIAITLRIEFLTGVKRFLDLVLQTYGFNPSIADLPISFETRDLEYDDKSVLAYLTFLAPGMMILVSYFLPSGLTNFTFLLEKQDGMIQRIYVAGVTDAEIVIGFCLTQGFVMSIQIVCSLMFMLGVFDVPCNGPLIWVIVLVLLVGWHGMFHGLLISAVVDDEYLVLFCQIAYFFPSFMLSGIVWPLEGVPNYLQFLSYAIPQTYPVQAIRALLLRGWGIARMLVWRGILVTLGWLIVFIIATIIVQKYRRH